MKSLPNVTIAIVDCKHHQESIEAILKSLQHVSPHSVLFFTDKHPHEFKSSEDPNYEKITFCLMERPIRSKQAYSEFIVKELWREITTTHVLVIQHDGYVLDGNAWTDEFMEYDYIGAPWEYYDGRDVGNGGFSLRSYRLMHVLGTDDEIFITHPEDEITGRLYRHYLEKTHNIKFAPEPLAEKFAFELRMPTQSTFGFHGPFWQPFHPRVVLKRSGAMGDVIMMEPLMEYFYNKGYFVLLDVPGDIYMLFDKHHFPVFHASQISEPNIRHIDLDMAYENNPKQLALKSYFEAAGVTDYELRNSRLNYPVTEKSRLFDHYVVMHVDDTDMEHRNVHGVDWDTIADTLIGNGYTVITIGNGTRKYGTFMRCLTKSMMMYVIAGADFFIGVDSGPSQAAVALGVKAFICFGSVKPEYRYHDLSNITVIQNKCPFEKDGCYHEVIGVRGQDCVVDEKQPPCITHSTENIIACLTR
jgi:hypothetical protein